MIEYNNYFSDQQSSFKNVQLVKYTKRNYFMKKNLGVSVIVFELYGFKAKISALLERHRCHSKDSCVASVNKFEPFGRCFTSVRYSLLLIKK